MSDRAMTVIPLPLSVVESSICEVMSWTTFVAGVEWVERQPPDRFVAGVRQGRRVHAIPVTVRWHPGEHRVTWRELEGPAWRGELRLMALNGRRTRVMMEVTDRPRTFGVQLALLFGRRQRQVGTDLGRLAERLARIPQPFNASRLVPGQSEQYEQSGQPARLSPPRVAGTPGPLTAVE
jgi:uncharacterized membrane protein